MKTILVIEDNSEIRENTIEILELSNYKVYTAVNGKDGINKALKFKPDLIVCDIKMPELDGFETLEVIQKNEELKYIPFIFLTALSENVDKIKAINLGAHDFVIKPLGLIDLPKTIEMRLNNTNNKY